MNSYSLRQQILFIITAGLSLIVVFNFVERSYTKNKVDSALREFEVDSETLKSVSEIKFNFKSQVQAWKDLLIRGANPDNYKKYSEELAGMKKKIEAQAESLKAKLNTEQKTLIDQFLAENDKLVNAYTDAKEKHLSPAHFDMASADMAVKGKDRPVADALKQLEASAVNASEASQSDAQRTISSVVKIATGIQLIVTVVAFLAAYTFANRLTRRILDLSEQISQESNGVHSASVDVSTESDRLSEAITEQAASLEQTSSALAQLTSMVSQTADGARESSNAANEAKEKSEEGSSGIQQMLNSMSEIQQINETVRNQLVTSNAQMTEVARLIREIEDKTGIINDIVFQTKLLSFNASVEAARAGEQGKGFAVVAEEVGHLAQMSGNAAKEISTILQAGVHRVEEIVKANSTNIDSIAEMTKSKINDGVEISEKCQSGLEAILQKTSRQSELANEISKACMEQSNGIEEVNKAVTQFDAATAQNASSTQRLADSVKDLSGQAKSLEDLASELRNIVSGDRIQKDNVHTADFRQKIRKAA